MTERQATEATYHSATLRKLANAVFGTPFGGYETPLREAADALDAKDREIERLTAKLDKIKADSEQVVLRDGHALPRDVYVLTRRIFMEANVRRIAEDLAEPGVSTL